MTKDPTNSRASRPSIEAKFRSWTADSSAAYHEEQRLKDAATVSSSIRRRWAIIAAGLGRAEAGSLVVRAPACVHDELGFLVTSFNRMLDETSRTIATVQREMDEVVILAEVLLQAAGGVLDSSKSVAATSAELARGMAEQRELAEEGCAQSTKAALRQTH